MKQNITHQQGQYRWLWLTALILAMDQLTKHLMVMTLDYHQIWPIFPGLNLTLIFNYGAAFSILNMPQSVWPKFLLASVAIVAVVVICYWLQRLPKRENMFAAGLSLIAGGALGNLYDRLAFGYVIDFIDIYVSHYHWPAFNVADSAICIGALCLLIRMLRRR